MKPASEQILSLAKLGANEPTALTPSQIFLSSYIDHISFFWWAMWVCILVFLIATYIIKPIVSPTVKTWRHRQKK